MTIFFDDRPFRIVRAGKLSEAESAGYDRIVDLRLEKLHKGMLSGHVLFLNATFSAARQIIHLLEQEPPKELLSITLATREKAEMEDKIKGLYKVVKAAGGVVVKNGKWLFMYRRKKWDLPKGKLDKGESSRTAAAREIEEETGVNVALKEKICTTWHTYALNNNRILKRTKWYLFDCVDDSHMQPQVEEQIEKLEWCDSEQVRSVLVNSYSSIRYVVDSLRKMQKAR